jgi:hypothetical protein
MKHETSITTALPDLFQRRPQFAAKPHSRGTVPSRARCPAREADEGDFEVLFEGSKEKCLAFLRKLVS